MFSEIVVYMTLTLYSCCVRIMNDHLPRPEVQIMCLGLTDNILHFEFVPLSQTSYLRTAALLWARANSNKMKACIKLYLNMKP